MMNIKYLLANLLIAIVLTLSCHATSIATSFGTAGVNTRITAIAPDNVGNIYVIGTFAGDTLKIDEKSITKLGRQDAFVAKFTSDASLLWIKNFGGNQGAFTYSTGLTLDKSGNILVAGFFQGADLTNPALPKHGIRDAFVAKLDKDGNTIWAKNFGGENASTYSSSIGTDSQANVIFGGHFSLGNLTAPSMNKIGTADAYIIKLDTNGNEIWSRNYGGKEANVASSAVAIDRQTDEILLGGNYTGSNLSQPKLEKIGKRDAFLIKIDLAGNPEWAKSFGGKSGSNTYTTGITIDKSNNIFLSGYFTDASLTNPALERIGNYDALVMKLSAGGIIQWSKNYGGPGANAAFYGIALDAEQNAMLSGQFTFANLTRPAIEKTGNLDTFIVHLDDKGDTNWSQSFGGSFGAYAYNNALAIEKTGYALLGGYFTYDSLNRPKLQKIGNQDAFLIKQIVPPSRPTIDNVLAGNKRATLSFTAPLTTGGDKINDYVISSNTGDLKTTSCSASPCVVEDLINGQTYTFTVAARNEAGISAPSLPSQPVVPSDQETTTNTSDSAALK